MKKTAAFLLTLCMLLSFPLSALAAEAEIHTKVPYTHCVTVEADDTASVFHNGQKGTSFDVDRLSDADFLVRAESGYTIKAVYLNGEDVTDRLHGGVLTVESIYEEKNIRIETEKITAIPSGDKYTVQGTVTKGGKPYGGVTMELRGANLKTAVTDKNGVFSLDGVQLGNYSLTAAANGKAVGYMEFELQIGEKAAYTLLENGSYLITVPDKTATIELNFYLSEDGKLVITDMDTSMKADGPSTSPSTGDEFDVMMTATAAVVSAGAILLLLLVYKRRKETAEQE